MLNRGACAPRDYEWLVDARNRNQQILLRLLRFGTPSDQAARDKVTESVYLLLVGAAFSLWRAAFLSDAEREARARFEKAVKLVEILLADNAVTYPKDRETRDWMSGYYLNNARYRLARALAKLNPSNVVDNESYQVFESLRRLDEEGIPAGKRPTKEWDLSHDALVALTEVLEKGIVSDPQGGA